MRGFTAGFKGKEADGEIVRCAGRAGGSRYPQHRRRAGLGGGRSMSKRGASAAMTRAVSPRPERASKKACHSERSEESTSICAAFSEVRTSCWILRCAQNDKGTAPFSTPSESWAADGNGKSVSCDWPVKGQAGFDARCDMTLATLLVYGAARFQPCAVRAGFVFFRRPDPSAADADVCGIFCVREPSVGLTILVSRTIP